ncbi:MotA/TolQ/ExbB proton channel family protein [Candidatus Cardinium hertigii]|uniref:Protein TolQ n=1 Tax=Candidatus Cardinium hertigii TaxID=247481 RepID=A0A2Z3LAF4_9BACT|nr:MotA/TolQ/ExbB proton channel family protein [Candidatus Cardinium hertigii]AWN82301.1 Protein TolQ [Candidatus Cardinium hertigii]
MLSTTFLSLLLKGGWLMLPLMVLSLLSVYIMVERWLSYRTHLYHIKDFANEVEKQLNSNDLESVYQLCLPQYNMIQKVLYKGLEQRNLSSTNLALLLEGESNRQIALLEEKLSFLATISGVAPMIGFLGSVMGMVQAFMAIAQEQNQLSSQYFSNGIYEAMVTTIVGLIIGITAYVGYNFFVARVNHAAQKLNYLATLFLTKVR